MILVVFLVVGVGIVGALCLWSGDAVENDALENFEIIEKNI